jgi:hypothetical protein
LRKRAMGILLIHLVGVAVPPRCAVPPTHTVMAGHRRPKDGVATLAYDPASMTS